MSEHQSEMDGLLERLYKDVIRGDRRVRTSAKRWAKELLLYKLLNKRREN